MNRGLGICLETIGTLTRLTGRNEIATFLSFMRARIVRAESAWVVWSGKEEIGVPQLQSARRNE